MVCAFGTALAIAGTLYPFLRGDRVHALRITVAAARWGVAAVLAASALQFAAAPRADQPLIDLAEYPMPSLRSALSVTAPNRRPSWMQAPMRSATAPKRSSSTTVERRNRTEGEALDDFSVARISSFLKSYGEMRKGEQFVMDEIRARARERIRWSASLGLLAFALLLAPVPWRRMWARLR